MRSRGTTDLPALSEASENESTREGVIIDATE